MRSWWPLSDRAVKLWVIIGSVPGVAFGTWFLLSVQSLYYTPIMNSFPWFIGTVIVTSIGSLVVMASCLLRQARLRKQGATKKELWPIKKLTLLLFFPFYIPHAFLFGSQFWFETTGKERMDQMNKQASYAFKQRLLVRKAAREQGRKVPPL